MGKDWEGCILVHQARICTNAVGEQCNVIFHYPATLTIRDCHFSMYKKILRSKAIF